MNWLLYVALIAVVVVFFLLSWLEKRKFAARDAMTETRVNQKVPKERSGFTTDSGADFFDDLRDFGSSLGTTLIYFFKLIGHAWRGFVSVMKEFWGWYRKPTVKNEKVQSRRQNSSVKRS